MCVRLRHRYINMNQINSDNRRMPEESHISFQAVVATVPEHVEGSLDDTSVEEDFSSNYYHIERESVMNFLLIPKMALYLSPKVIEKICDKIFSRKGVNEEFVELFYEHFFRVYVKHEKNCCCIC